MDGHNLRCYLVVALVLASCLSAGLSSASGSRCDQLRRAIEQKKHLVSEYMRALQKSYDRKELQIADLVNYKINELKVQIRELERNLARCPNSDAEKRVEGMVTTKSDQGKYSDKDCQELHKTLFSLIRKIHSLNKRKNSLLLNFSEKDELLLQEATEERNTVEHILTTRCSAKDRRGGLDRGWSYRGSRR